MTVLRCDMEKECADDVTHIDTKGWVYCEQHGRRRHLQEGNCRVLTLVEHIKLHAGEPINYERKVHT